MDNIKTKDNNIQFRAWDSINNCYIEDGFDVRIDGHGSVYKRVWGETNWDRTINLIIEFFTGLLDKNGKKIYRGDKVRCLTGWWPGIVAWHAEGSIGWAIEPLAEFKHNGCYGMNSYDEFEVIGNIHDNKNLLDNPELMPNGGKD